MIKMIAVDMDGTFLDDEKNYDRERFAQQYKEMKERGIKFVVASGNQYLHLESFFPDSYQELTFICENGAQVISQQETLFTVSLTQEIVDRLLETVQKVDLGISRLILSGENGAYLLNSTKEEFLTSARFFYHNLVFVDDYSEVEDVIYKISMIFQPERKNESTLYLQKLFAGEANVLTSGFTAVDMVSKKAGKEVGLGLLQEKWGITDQELACFGDNHNDLAMLRKAKYSFAMGNAKDDLKKAASKVIGSNNEQAVLDQIDEILANN